MEPESIGKANGVSHDYSTLRDKAGPITHVPDLDNLRATHARKEVLPEVDPILWTGVRHS